MDHWPRHLSADEVQAALGDEPFVVRGMWPGATPAEGWELAESGTAAPEPLPLRAVAAANLRAPAVAPPQTASHTRPGGAASAADATGARVSRGDGSRRRRARRRRSLVLTCTGTALAGGLVGVLLMPLPNAPWRDLATAAPRAAPRAVPAPLMLAVATPATASVPFPAPAPQAADLAPEPAAPWSLAATPPLAEARTPAAAPAAGTPATSAAAEALPRLSDPMLAAALMGRADSALARGDIAAARAFFVRAASVDPWSGQALIGVGKTYDPGFLSSLGVAGGLADPAQARHWYDRASRLGDPAAEVLAGGLGEGR